MSTATEARPEVTTSTTDPVLHAFCWCMETQIEPKSMCGQPKQSPWDYKVGHPNPENQCIVCVELIHAQAICPACGRP